MLFLPLREKFVAIMSEMGNEFESVATKMADAQSLWDATMVSQSTQVPGWAAAWRRCFVN